MSGAATTAAATRGTVDTVGVDAATAPVFSTFTPAGATTGAATGAVLFARDAARVAGLEKDPDTWLFVAGPDVDASVDFLLDVFLGFFDVVECLPVLVVSVEDCAEITTPPPKSAVGVDPDVV